MQRVLNIMLILVFAGSSCLFGDLQQTQRDTDRLWSTGAGTQDGAFTAVSSSILAWGGGLAVVIGLITALIQPSTASTTHSHSHAH